MTAVEHMKKFLREQGFIINENDDYVTFKYQTHTFVMFKGSNECLFALNIIFYDVDDTNYSKVLQLCNKLNKDKSVIKLYVMNDSVICAYEAFVDDHFSTENLPSIMNIMISSLRDFAENI